MAKECCAGADGETSPVCRREGIERLTMPMEVLRLAAREGGESRFLRSAGSVAKLVVVQRLRVIFGIFENSFFPPRFFECLLP